MKKLLIIGAVVAAFATGSTAFAEDAYVYSTEVSSNGGEGSSVNIDYCMKTNSRIEVDFQYPETPTKDVLFGAWGVPNSDATPGLRMACWNTGGKFCFILDSDAYYNHISTVALDSARHTAVIDAPNRAFRLLASDGTVQWSGSVASGRNVSGEATWPIVLFGCAKNAAGLGNQHVKAKIYSVKIYETANGVETLVRDLVPCIKGDSIGFYDRLSDVFYGEQSTLGGLASGGDNIMTLQNDGYLQTPSSNNSKEKIAFNTGYCMTHDSRIEVDFQWLGTPKDLLFGAWRDSQLATGFWINANVFSFILNDGGLKSYGSSIGRDNYRHTAIVDVKNGSYSLKNDSGFVQYSGTIAANATCNNDALSPLVLFGNAANTSGTSEQWSYARIFSAKIYTNDTVLVKDFEPYVKDGAAGFMEKVSGTFTAISGIIAGGKIETHDAYVENDGVTVLNLGYRANMKSRIEVDYQCLNPTVNSRVFFGAWSAGNLRYTCWNNSNLVKFIFHGKNNADPQYTDSGYVPDDLRHTAIMDMKNQHIYYLTGNVTNYSRTATANTFNDTDTSYPMGVFGTIDNDAGTSCNSMISTSRFYSVRIYEDEELIHEFLPYTDGTTVSLRDVIAGHVATKVKSTMADPTIQGIGVDGAERCVVMPQSAAISNGQTVTLKAVAVGSVSRYKWTRNGEAVSGGSNGELNVSWRHTKTPDVYAVTPVYSLAGAEVEGAAVSVMVENVPQGMVIIFK